MVLQRRVDYGFNGYQVPAVPRASRSARGRGPIRKKWEDNQIRGFEVLASVAGKLLEEGETSASSNALCGKAECDGVKIPVKHVQEDRGRFFIADLSPGETCYENTSACRPACRPGLQCFHQNYNGYKLNDILHAQDSISFKGFDYSEKTYVAENLVAGNNRNVCGSPSSKVGGDSPCAFQLFEGQVDDVIERKHESELLNITGIGNGTLPVKDSLGDNMELDMNPPPWAGPKSNLKVSLFRDCIALGPLSGGCSDVKVISRDNDENSLGCFPHDTMAKTYKLLSYVGDRRRRHLSVSRHKRVASNVKSGGYLRTGGTIESIYHRGRSWHSYQRSQKSIPFKKRKFFDQNPLAVLNGSYHQKDIFNSPGRRTKGEKFGPATGTSSSMSGQEASPDSMGCNVKLSIKSFKVPELFVEIPATATVGSLKRIVMEGVSAILGDGLHVGILFQGKKVRDDSKTLLQTGISKDDKHSSLGFMLEPRQVKITPPPCSENPSFLSCGAPSGLTRPTTSLKLQPGISSVECDLGSAPFHADTSTGNTRLDSQALVPVPSIGMEALAMVPFNPESRHLEFGQRRIRRPFSVPEVEALVHAVEKLGTGRWRDVKLCAFDNANHRTYVDLKDKWKTLVHTAKISPQQRRGEPVPQELLDRVLAADAYWSQQQAKQQGKAAV